MKNCPRVLAALAFTVLGCGSSNSGSNKVGAVGQPCTSGGGCDPGLSCRASDHICEAGETCVAGDCVSHH